MNKSRKKSGGSTLQLDGTTHYMKNKSYYKNKRDLFRIKRSEWFRELKDNKPCADCGNKFPHYVLQHDHLPGAEKLFNVSTAVTQGISIKKIKLEIEKCELVCANCHAKRTYDRRNL